MEHMPPRTLLQQPRVGGKLDEQTRGTEISKQASRRFDPEMGCIMTYPEACLALCHAQMTDEQMWAYWGKMQPVLASEVLQRHHHPRPTLVKGLELTTEAPCVTLRILNMSGQLCFSGDVPRYCTIGQLKARIVCEDQSEWWTSIQLSANGELLSDDFLAGDLLPGAELCLV